MNIIYARMVGYDGISVPSDAVARELERLGHKITLVEDVSYIAPGRYDFVWSPYESVTALGHVISKKLGIPHFAHVETIPPWRYFRDCDSTQYGFPSPDVIDVPDLEIAREHYTKVAEFWQQAHIKTISNQSRVKMHEDEFGITDLQLRYPSVDVATIEAFKKAYNPPKEDVVLTISRLTFIKRLDLIVDVMNKMDKPVIWRVIGDGPYLDTLKERLTNKNVKLELLGALWGWARFYEMAKAKVIVHAMGGMPPIEAALLGAMPICIEQQPTLHLPEFDKFMYYNFGDSMPIFKYNEPEKAKDCILEELQAPQNSGLTRWGTIDKFFSGETNVTPSAVNAKNIIRSFNDKG